MSQFRHTRMFKAVTCLLLVSAVLLNSPRAAGHVSAIPATQADPAQALVRIWSGAWSGSSFGRNNPGQPAPSAPIAGNWVLDVRTVDLAHNTASGFLTWTGKDAYWTYEILPNGTTVPTPHDFIPNRTIQFDSSNTTLSIQQPGSPQFHLSIEGFRNAPNPSDEFYGPRIQVDLFTDTGTVVTQGIGFSAHPYNPANFDTAFSSGIVTGGTNVCTPGITIGNVGLPEVTVPFVIPNKPSWHIRYGQLGLDFTTVTPPANAICEARSNTGSLNVLGAPTPFGPFMIFAHSLANATLTTFKGSEVGGLATCNFFPFGTRNNCLLNGAFKTNTNYARWHTEGFTTEVNVLHLAGEPDFLRTGPLTFWVDINSLPLTPASTWMESVVRAAEPFIHKELIDHLPLITTYAIIQDPGKVSLFVVKDGIFGTGKSEAGTTITNIPRSLYFESDTNPAVILLEPDAGNYKIFVNGIETGDYALSVSTTKLPANTTEAASATGNITQANRIVYDLNLTDTANGIGQSFNAVPVPFPSIQLIMAAPPSPSDSAAALDSVFHTRDAFPLLNPPNLMRGSDLRTRVKLLVAYLRLTPGEAMNAVTVEAMDVANNVYALEVEDVREVPNTTLSQVTVRLSENLPNGRISLRVGLHGKVTEWGTVMIQK